MKNNIHSIALTGVLLATLIAIQFLKMPTPVAGVAINAIFIFALLSASIANAAALAFLSPICAFLTGTLAAPLYPLVPVILAGNLVYVFLYNYLKKSSRLIRILFPSLTKGLIISLIGFKLIEYLQLTENIKWLLIPVLGLQFLTSILGIILAEIIYGRRRKKSR